MLKTQERMQPQDKFEVDEYKKPTDERLKKFNVGKLVQFTDRTALITGVVGGFTMSDIEQLWVRDIDVEQHSRHRADNVEFLREIKIAKKSKKKVKKEVKKVKKVKKNDKTSTTK